MRLRSTDRSAEAGVIIPFLALSIIMIFTLLGLAIDGGRLYSARLEAQIAADAAAFSAAAMIATNNNDYGTLLSNPILGQAITAGENLALQNTRFHAKAWTGTTANVTVDLTDPARPIVVNSRVEHIVPLTFMRVLPGIGSTRRVVALASSEVTPALGALALDSSGSMNCPMAASGDPLCGCYPNCPDNAAAKFRSVLEIVDTAFLSKFDRTRDQISVMMYDKTTAELVSIKPTGGFTGNLIKDDEDEYVQSVKLFDVTNVTAAIMNSYLTLDPFFQVNPDRVPFIALLSDGAPTATCMRPVDFQPGMNAQFANPGDRNACFWEIFWEGYFDPADPLNHTDPNRQLSKPGISAIGRIGNIHSQPMHVTAAEYPTAVIFNKVDPPFNKPGCSQLTFTPWGGATNEGLPENGQSEIGTCLASYRFADLNGDVFPKGANDSGLDAPLLTPSLLPVQSGIGEWRKAFYHTAIAQADAIRRRGYVIYTVGLGLDSSPNDLWNNINSIITLKRHFLNRLALPYGYSKDFPGMTAAGTLINQDRHTKGEFYPVPTGNTVVLENTFRELVRRVKLRMCS